MPSVDRLQYNGIYNNRNTVDPLSDSNLVDTVPTNGYRCKREIPDNILKNKYWSLDLKKNIYQNDKQFGLIPLDDLMTYTGHEVVWGNVPELNVGMNS